MVYKKNIGVSNFNIFVEKEYCKTYEDLHSHLVEVYGGAIHFDLINNADKMISIFERIKNFILRVLYKSRKLLPFDDKLISNISTLLPTKFDKNLLVILANRA